jgi:hypothetical protein
LTPLQRLTGAASCFSSPAAAAGDDAEADMLSFQCRLPSGEVEPGGAGSGERSRRQTGRGWVQQPRSIWGISGQRPLCLNNHLDLAAAPLFFFFFSSPDRDLLVAFAFLQLQAFELGRIAGSAAPHGYAFLCWYVLTCFARFHHPIRKKGRRRRCAPSKFQNQKARSTRFGSVFVHLSRYASDYLHMNNTWRHNSERLRLGMETLLLFYHASLVNKKEKKEQHVVQMTYVRSDRKELRHLVLKRKLTDLDCTGDAILCGRGLIRDETDRNDVNTNSDALSRLLKEVPLAKIQTTGGFLSFFFLSCFRNNK